MTIRSRIRLDRSEPDRMNPGAALLLFGAIVAGFIKLILPQSATGLRWEYLYLMVGAAAVLVLDSIRGAIADRGRWLTNSPYAVGSIGQPQTIGPVSTQSPVSSQKSEKSGGGTENLEIPRRNLKPAQ